jgi:hypothetical protein
MPAFKLDREAALKELKGYGIAGPQVYLLNIVPLLEMMWADGKIQDGELELLEEFTQKHVSNVNTLAQSAILSQTDAEQFLNRFTQARPDPRLLEQLRQLIPPVWLSNSDAVLNAQRREDILQWCLDIGAACVSEYPYGNRDRFDASEKECFQSILNTLSRGG